MLDRSLQNFDECGECHCAIHLLHFEKSKGGGVDVAKAEVVTWTPWDLVLKCALPLTSL